MKQTDYASLYLQYLVAIKTAGYDFKKPIRWASLTYNPNYLDNRVGVSVVGSRRILRKALPLLIENPGTIDYIYGVPKGGIAPATLLALEIHKPLLFKHDGSYYSIDVKEVAEWYQDHLNDHRTFSTCSKVIAATVPFGITFGIVVAELMKLPFLFIRDAPKDHGKMQQVEGRITEGLWAKIIDPMWGNLPTPESDESSKVLENVGVHILSTHYPRLNDFIRKVNITGKKIAAIEDVVSTGESSLKSIVSLITEGAAVSAYAIFSYDFRATIANFAQYGLVLKSVANFSQLTDEYRNQGIFVADEESRLWNWYNNQPTWGDEHGFPSDKV